MNDEEPPELSFIEQSIEQNRQCFKKAFQQLAKDWLKANQNNVTNIISIGCGPAFEMKPLRQIFPNAVLKGVDNDKSVVDGAENNAEVDQIPNVQFIHADTAKDAPYMIDGNKGMFQLVILRSPNILAILDTWKHIIQKAALNKPHLNFSLALSKILITASRSLSSNNSTLP